MMKPIDWSEKYGAKTQGLKLLDLSAVDTVEAAPKKDDGFSLTDPLGALKKVGGGVGNAVVGGLTLADKAIASPIRATVFEGLDLLPGGQDASLGELRDNLFSGKGAGDYVEERAGELPWAVKVAAGFALDVALDPLTYVTAGSSVVAKQGGKGAARAVGGGRVLRGKDVATEILRVGDDAATGFVKADVDRFAKEALQSGGHKVDPEFKPFLEEALGGELRGGMQFMGKQLPGTQVPGEFFGRLGYGARSRMQSRMRGTTLDGEKKLLSKVADSFNGIPLVPAVRDLTTTAAAKRGASRLEAIAVGDVAGLDVAMRTRRNNNKAANWSTKLADEAVDLAEEASGLNVDGAVVRDVIEGATSREAVSPEVGDLADRVSDWFERTRVTYNQQVGETVIKHRLGYFSRQATDEFRELLGVDGVARPGVSTALKARSLVEGSTFMGVPLRTNTVDELIEIAGPDFPKLFNDNLGDVMTTYVHALQRTYSYYGLLNDLAATGLTMRLDTKAMKKMLKTAKKQSGLALKAGQAVTRANDDASAARTEAARLQGTLPPQASTEALRDALPSLSEDMDAFAALENAARSDAGLAQGFADEIGGTVLDGDAAMAKELVSQQRVVDRAAERVRKRTEHRDGLRTELSDAALAVAKAQDDVDFFKGAPDSVTAPASTAVPVDTTAERATVALKRDELAKAEAVLAQARDANVKAVAAREAVDIDTAAKIADNEAQIQRLREGAELSDDDVFELVELDEEEAFAENRYKRAKSAKDAAVRSVRKDFASLGPGDVRPVRYTDQSVVAEAEQASSGYLRGLEAEYKRNPHYDLRMEIVDEKKRLAGQGRASNQDRMAIADEFLNTPAADDVVAHTANKLTSSLNTPEILNLRLKRIVRAARLKGAPEELLVKQEKQLRDLMLNEGVQSGHKAVSALEKQLGLPVLPDDLLHGAATKLDLLDRRLYEVDLLQERQAAALERKQAAIAARKAAEPATTSPAANEKLIGKLEADNVKLAAVSVASVDDSPVKAAAKKKAAAKTALTRAEKTLAAVDGKIAVEARPAVVVVDGDIAALRKLADKEAEALGRKHARAVEKVAKSQKTLDDAVQVLRDEKYLLDSYQTAWAADVDELAESMLGQYDYWLDVAETSTGAAFDAAMRRVEVLDRVRTLSETVDAADETLTAMRRVELVAARAEFDALTHGWYKADAISKIPEFNRTDLELFGRYQQGQIGKVFDSLNLWAEPDAAVAFQQVFEQMRPEKLEGFWKVVKGYDAILSRLKAQQLLSPGYHVRNFYSALFMNHLAGMQGAGSLRTYRQVGKFWKVAEDVSLDAALDTVPAVQRGLYTEMWDNRGALSGVRGSRTAKTRVRDFSDAQSQFGTERGLFSKSDAAMRRDPTSMKWWGYEKNFNAATRVERSVRGALWMDGRLRGMGVDASTDRVMQYHFDYAELSNVERRVMKRIIPFYTWARKNFPLQIEHMARKPGAYSAFIHAKTSIESSVEAQQVVPAFYGALGAIHTPFSMGGSDVYATPELPFIGINEFFSLDSNLANMSPLIKTPLEVWSGKQFFEGIPLDKENLKPIPAAWSWLGPILDATSALTTIEARKGRDGTYYLTPADAHKVEQGFPLLGRLRRLAPGDEAKYRDRRTASWLSIVGGVSTRTNTPAAQESELKRRDATALTELKRARQLAGGT